MASTYPRPDFQRKALTWASLDGPWSFLFDDKDTGLSQLWQKTGLPEQSPASPALTDSTKTNSKREIKVPYAFQTLASGINLREAHEVLWYERTITDIRSTTDLAKGNRLLLRFGAVDYDCSVWVDGCYIGGHRGGHVPFDLDISDAVSSTSASASASARLTLRVRDSPYDLAQPRGKQFWGPVPENIFYTPTGGIWQSVWLESVPFMRIGGGSAGTVLRSDDIEGGVLRAQVAVLGRAARAECSVEIEASLGGRVVGGGKGKVRGSLKERDWVGLDVCMKVLSSDVSLLEKDAPFNVEGCWHDGVALWSPEHPILYDLTLRLYDAAGKVVDEVATTTGMRSLSWQNGDGTFRLNGKPYFQMLFLDQGYWPETGLTPPSSEALRLDIQMAKDLGFNGCRKHQKVEDPRFHYWADRLGFVVWGEMANAYEFGPDYIERMNGEWTEAVKRDINHPCIVTWTPNNESWAYTSLKDDIEQRNHIRSLYYLTKTLDPSRPINDNCGWEHVLTDLTTYHDYSDSAELSETCSKMEGGILAPKAGHDMFSRPIYSGFAGHTLLDPGAAHKAGAPVICTEFGGVNIAPGKGDQAGERDWGYTTATDIEDFLKRYERLVMAIVKGGHTCGLVYTQL
jgi:beta-galactosidase/beta-glucuronidase